MNSCPIWNGIEKALSVSSLQRSCDYNQRYQQYLNKNINKLSNMYDIALCKFPCSAVHCSIPKSFLFKELIWLKFMIFWCGMVSIYRHCSRNKTAHFRNISNQCSFPNCFVQRERVENTSHQGEMQVTIQNLMPATVYIFRVMAHNKHGSGESSAPLRVETQPEGKSPTCLSAPLVGMTFK